MLVCSGLYFLWLIMDNVDGKQARRTHTSSPLGLLFDHQVDALNVTITATYLATIALMGDSEHSLMLWFIGAVPFFFATWEEMLVGAMNFPTVNLPCDGCLALGLLGLLFAILSPEYFLELTVFGLNGVQWLYYFAIVGALL